MNSDFEDVKKQLNMCFAIFKVSSNSTRTRPELNFAPVPESPVKSGTGTRLCHWYLSRKCAIKITLEYVDLSRKFTYN